MGYLQEVDRWLDVLMTDFAQGKLSFDEMKRDIRERILDSYRNGQKAVAQSAPERERRPRRFKRPTKAHP